MAPYQIFFTNFDLKTVSWGAFRAVFYVIESYDYVQDCES